MADAVKLLADLKEFQASLAYNGWPEAETVSQAIAELERLTPRPMTFEEIAGLFNEHQIDGTQDWEARLYGLRSQKNVHFYGRWHAEAVAEKLLRDGKPDANKEKEAARA